MTIYELEVLLWYWVRTEDHPDMGLNPPNWKGSIMNLEDRKLLEAYEGDNTSYRVTERGEVYIKAIQRLPLPEQRWVMPESKG